MDSASTTTGKTILVHKEGEEGSIQVDARTGKIVTGVDDRPGWADGLVVALLAERHGFYSQRLGPKYASDHADPSAIVFQDLGWIGVDAEGEECELEADSDYRMEVVASVLGINREDFESDEQFGATVAEAEIAMDQWRSDSEVALVDESLSQTFGQGEGASETKKTSGNG